MSLDEVRGPIVSSAMLVGEVPQNRGRLSVNLAIILFPGWNLAEFVNIGCVVLSLVLLLGQGNLLQLELNACHLTEDRNRSARL